MYCDKCGSQLPENAKFCGNCGNPIQNDMMKPPVTLPLPKRRKIIPLAAAVVILILCAIVFWAYGANTLNRADKLAQKGKYEKALELYDGILEKEPLNLKANLGKLYVYSNMKNNSSLYQTYQRALTIIRQMEPEETAKHGETICQIYLYAGEVYQHNNENRNAALIEGMQYLERDMGCSDQYLEKLREIVQELYDGQQREELIKVCETLIKLEAEQIQYQDMAVQASQGQFKILVAHKEFEEAEALLEKYESHLSEITVKNLRNLMNEKKEELPFKTVIYDDNWNEASETQKDYNNWGQLKKTTFSWSGSSTVTTCTYDDFGNVIRIQDGNDTKNYTYVYDLAGNVLEETVSTGYYYQYEYDDNGNLVKATTSYKGDTIQYTQITTNEYDEKGKLTKSETVDEQGNLDKRYLYDYWENGNYKQSVCELSSGFIDIIDYWENGKMKRRTSNYGVSETYDQEGKMLESKLYIDGKLDDYMKCQYNTNGDVISIERLLYGSTGNGYTCTDTYEYEYDEKGRIVSEKVYRGTSLLEWYEYVYY